MHALKVSVLGIGALGPGFGDWPALRAALGGAPYQPQPTALPLPAALPPAEQRRVGPAVKLALAVGGEAIAASDIGVTTLASVFAASGGDGENCDALCRTLALPQPQLSPTRFHNSVQNAAAGYWSIAHRVTAASISIAGFDASFALGLLEAAAQVSTQQRAVLLICSDTAYPEPLRSVRPIPDALGIALLLAPPGPASALATLHIAMDAGTPDRLELPALEQLRAAIPAARALPLLRQIAGGGVARIEYLSSSILRVEVDNAA